MRLFTSRFTLCLVISMLSGAQAVRFLPEGERKWDGPFAFQVNVRNKQTQDLHEDVSFKCHYKIPQKYILVNQRHFPTLKLENQTSRDSFVKRMTDYVAQLKIIRREYTYEGLIGTAGLTVNLKPPHQSPLNCTLESLAFSSNYELERLELSSLLIKTVEETPLPLDIAPKVRKLYGKVPLPPLRTEGESHFEQIVCTNAGLDGSVFDSIGSINYYQKPHIPGVSGFEESTSEIRTVSYAKASIPYEESIASRISPPLSQSGLVYVGEVEELNDQESFLDTQSVSGMSTVLDHDFEVYKHFKLIGHEERTTSPYIYYDGTQAFLTQTFEQDCLPLVSGKVEPTDTYRLRYTLSKAYPVSIPGSKPYSWTSGLYQLRDKCWLKVNDFYEEEEEFEAHKRPTPEGIFTQTLRSQDTHNYDLVTTFKQSKPLHDYIEFEKEAKFQQLLNQFQQKTKGLFKTVEALTSQEQHLIVPLLVILRERKDFEDPDLVTHKKEGLYDPYIYKNSPVWRYYEESEPPFSSTYDVLKRNTQYCISKNTSLNLLALASHSDSSYYNSLVLQGFFTFSLGVNNYTYESIPWNKSVPFGFGKESYDNIAHFLSFDTFEGFRFQFDNDDIESDKELIIQLYSRVIRNLKNLKKLYIHDRIGVRNLEYLIDHGLAQNHSIEFLDYNGVGEYPMALLGRLLAKNTTLKSLMLQPIAAYDLECLNEFGRGLALNSTLEELIICLYGYTNHYLILRFYSDWVQQGELTDGYDIPIRPLPGRPRGSQATDFLVFQNALLKSNLKKISVVGGHNSPIFARFLAMLRGINKPGLEITITKY